MQVFEQVIAEAKRIEIDEHSGKLFIVFEVVSERMKQRLKTEWVNDIEFRMIGKELILEGEE